MFTRANIIRSIDAHVGYCQGTRSQIACKAHPVVVHRRYLTVCNLVLALGMSVLLAACDSDLNTTSEPGNASQQPTGGSASSDSNGIATNGSLTLQVGTGIVQLIEGEDAISVPLSLTRSGGDSDTVQLSAAGRSSSDETNLSWEFSDSNLDSGESASNLILSMSIGARPISQQTRTLLITADSGSSAAFSAELAIAVQPTARPDVYLLVGQSNMMGFSEDDSKQAGPGGPDAPVARIKQLNVTGNDDENFPSEADFSNPASLYNTGMPLSPAVDPLHDGYDTSINGKAGTRIGPGLSFAKRALADTTADIILVPAGWSDTGFCKRDTNRFPDIGWNASAKSNPALSGTLLYQRAILRADIALEQSGGILRGILWHQGEADSDDAACATSYADNLVELASALRSNIQVDARGPGARGPDADIPFVVGTMSMGADANSDQTPFSDIKQLVDDTHRNVASLIPLADFVNNDDLVPPAYSCGEGSCVHFGAAAYREMGNRYYEQLIGLLP
jgi:hypothetical protein